MFGHIRWYVNTGCINLLYRIYFSPTNDHVSRSYCITTVVYIFTFLIVCIKCHESTIYTLCFVTYYNTFPHNRVLGLLRLISQMSFSIYHYQPQCNAHVYVVIMQTVKISSFGTTSKYPSKSLYIPFGVWS